MRRILVTGGAGFIGSNFIRFWLGRHPDDRITNLDKLTYAGNIDNLQALPRGAGYRFVRGDICDAQLVKQLLGADEIDTVVHFAAESHVDRSIMDPGEFIRTNVQGTFILLEAARNHWAGAGASGACRFVHVSTDEVYGSLSSGAPASTESAAYAPTSPYSASKAGSDHLARAYYHTYGLPVLITNASNNYGPYQFPEKLVPLAIGQALKGDSIPVYGDGGNVRDWLYVEDHCAALEAVVQTGRIGETYNIGGANQCMNIDVVSLICDLLDERLEPRSARRRSLIKFVRDRPGHDRRYALDSGKIERELGWSPAESLATGMAKTVDWYLAHGDWVERIVGGEYRKYFAAQYGARLKPY
jgi:dTDP-glucose 4,6-dehydratase